MKRVGIITTHYSNNYGALLQTHALIQYIKTNFDTSCDAIDFYPPWHINSWRLYKKPDCFINVLLNIQIFFKPAYRSHFRERVEKNKQFMAKYIPLSKHAYYTREDFTRYPLDEYDCLLCGSDQIWNIPLINDPVFFMDIPQLSPHIRRCAYAPSVVHEIPEPDRERVSNYLSALSMISVREKSDIERLAPLTDKPISCMIDPVFLMDRDYWQNLSDDSGKDERYIFCYFVGTDDFVPKAVHALKKHTRLPVYYLNIMTRDKIGADKCLENCGPKEFLGFIKNATYVCTNSFHCTAFSILFNKNFYNVPKGAASSRIQNLYQQFLLDDRTINKKNVDNLDTISQQVDYRHTQEKLKIVRDVSHNFLSSCLYGDNMTDAEGDSNEQRDN